MAVHRQKFSIVDAQTRSVTIFATTATVVRDITGVVVKPGINEYVITDISGFADGDSFQISGSGTDATIVGTASVLLRNRPAIADDESHTPDSSDSSDPEFDEDDLDLPATKEKTKLERELREIRRQRSEIQRDLENINREIFGWELVCQNVIEAKPGNDKWVPDMSLIKDCMTGYTTARAKGSKKYTVLQEEDQELESRQQVIDKKLSKLHHTYVKQVNKARAHHEELLQKRRAKKDQKQQKHRYPQTVLMISVEAKTMPEDAPKIEATVDAGKPKELVDDAPPPDATGPSLRIAYTVTNVHWFKRFDLALDTVKKSGVLRYHAEVHNMTGETWTNATVALSTAEQQPFTLAGSRAPPLLDWKIGLGGDTYGLGIKQSHYESTKSGQYIQSCLLEAPPRKGLFGATRLLEPPGANWISPEIGKIVNPELNASGPPFGGFGTSSATRGLFGGPTQSSGGSLFGSSGAQSAPPTDTAPQTGGLFGGSTQPSGGASGGTSAFGSSAFGSSVAQPSAPPPTDTAPQSGDSQNATSAPSQAPTAGGLFGSAAQPSVSSPFGGMPSSTPSTNAAPQPGSLFGAVKPAVAALGGGLFGQPSAPSTNAAPQSGGLFGAARPAEDRPPASGSGLFGQPSAPSTNAVAQSGGLFGAVKPAVSGGLFGQSGRGFESNNRLFPAASRFPFSTTSDPLPDSNHFNATPLPFDASAKFSTATSTVSTHGGVTTFTLPSKRTLPDMLRTENRMGIKCLLTSTLLPDLRFTHHVVPKIATFAFLDVHIFLPDEAPYIPEGDKIKVTIDHSVLGEIRAPKITNEWENFTGKRSLLLPIGLDASVSVAYDAPKHTEHKEGLMKKSLVVVQKRGCTIENNSRRSVDVRVRDQVPVVEKEWREKVKVRVLEPSEIQSVIDALRDPETASGAKKYHVDVPFSENTDRYGGIGDQMKRLPIGEKGENNEADAKQDEEKKNPGPGKCEASAVGDYGTLVWSWTIEPGGKRKAVLEWEVRAPVGNDGEGLVSLK